MDQAGDEAGYQEAEQKLIGFWKLEADEGAESRSSIAASLVNRDWREFHLRYLRARASEQKPSSHDYYTNLLRAHEASEMLFEAVHQTGDWESAYRKPKYVWAHQSIDLLKTNDPTRGVEIDKSGLLRAAAVYLSHPNCRTDLLDWQFLDAIVFQELDAFANQVITTKGGTGINYAAMFANGSPIKFYGLGFLFGVIGIAVNYVAIPALSIFLLLNDHAIWAFVVAAFWGISTFLKLISFPGRYKARKKAKDLLQHLIDLYAILGGQTISPRQLKDKLEKSVDAGVVLDGAVFSILDRLNIRDKTAFIPMAID